MALPDLGRLALHPTGVSSPVPGYGTRARVSPGDLGKQLTTCNDEKRRLQERNDHCKEELARTNAENQRLHEKIVKMTMDAASARQRVQILGEQKEGLRERLLARLARMTADGVASDGARARQDAEIRSLLQELRELDERLAQESQQLAETTAELAGQREVYSVEIQSLEEANAELQAERNEMQTQLSTLRVNLELLRKALEEAELALPDNTPADDSIRTVQDVFDPEGMEAFLNNAEELLNATEPINDAVDAAQQEYVQLTITVDALQGENTEVREAYDLLRVEIQGMQAHIERLINRGIEEIQGMMGSAQGGNLPTEPHWQAEALLSAVKNLNADRVRDLLTLDPPLTTKYDTSWGKYTRQIAWYIWGDFDKVTTAGRVKTFEMASAVLDEFAAHGYKNQIPHLEKRGNPTGNYMYRGTGDRYNGAWFLGTSDRAKVARKMIDLDMLTTTDYFSHWSASKGYFANMCRLIRELPEEPVKYKLAIQMLCYYPNVKPRHQYYSADEATLTKWMEHMGVPFVIRALNAARNNLSYFAYDLSDIVSKGIPGLNTWIHETNTTEAASLEDAIASLQTAIGRAEFPLPPGRENKWM